MTDHALTYTLITRPRGATFKVDFVEHIPYEPSAYHWDEGIIVARDETLYFISLSDGDIYVGADDDPDSLSKKDDSLRCIEIDAMISKRDAELAAIPEGE